MPSITVPASRSRRQIPSIAPAGFHPGQVISIFHDEEKELPFEILWRFSAKRTQWRLKQEVSMKEMVDILYDLGFSNRKVDIEKEFPGTKAIVRVKTFADKSYSKITEVHPTPPS